MSPYQSPIPGTWHLWIELFMLDNHVLCRTYNHSWNFDQWEVQRWCVETCSCPPRMKASLALPGSPESADTVQSRSSGVQPESRAGGAGEQLPFWVPGTDFQFGSSKQSHWQFFHDLCPPSGVPAGWSRLRCCPSDSADQRGIVSLPPDSDIPRKKRGLL